MKNIITSNNLKFLLRIIALVGMVIATRTAFHLAHSLPWFSSYLPEQMFNYSNIIDIVEPFAVVLIIYVMGIWAIKALHLEENKKC